MSFSTSSSPMAFTFGTHQSTPPFVFCREINGSSTLSRKRALADPSPSGPSRKKRRLRLSLTTSPLSLPFSTPRASSQPDRTSNHHRRTAILIFRPSQRLPQPPISASSPSPSSSCLLLRKAAVLNRVQQRMDAACQRNPNLRWEKEQRQERELLLKEGVQMRRMAALKDGLLSPVTSTRPVASPVNDVVPGHYSDPRRRLAATSHDVEDCERRCAEEKECTGGPQAAAAAAPVWFCSNTSYPSPPPSAVGLSNYDALDSEEEEKDDVAAPLPSMPQQHGDAATSIPESAGVVDEGMRDIFDFLTPPAMHRSFLSDFDDGQSEDDAAAVPGPASVSRSVHPDDDANDTDNDTSAVDESAGNADRDELVHVDAQGRLDQHHARAVPLKAGPHCTFQRCQSAPLVSRHLQHHMPHYHHHHHHHRRHDRQHHCAMAASAAAFVAVPRAYQGKRKGRD
ncbi:uncharacterized protein J3D65DRAFT_639874 [Phyllosticta citribraziliensis]|uniref:Uncharacterized protein n=1 Tax=Phyllosticta citribraziliensis TaxID=989973 RepID=A0ABR1L6M8_9PEZI